MIEAEIASKMGSNKDQALGGIPTSVRNSIATSTAKSFFDDRKVPVQPSDTAGMGFSDKATFLEHRPTAPVTPQAVDSALGIAGQFYGGQQQGSPEEQWGAANIDDWDSLPPEKKQQVIEVARKRGLISANSR